MSTYVPGGTHPYPPHPGQPVGFDTYHPGTHPYDPGGPFGGHATLANNLVSYWKLDETSGTRNDAHGTNHLTDNNTVGFAAGVSGNAATFVRANSEYLSRAAVTGFTTWTIDCWYKGTTVDDYAGIFLLSNGWDGPDNFMIYRYPTGNGAVLSLRLLVSNTVPTNFTAQVANAGSPTAWHHLLGTFDGTTLRFYIDNGAPVETAFSGTVYTAAASLRIGATTLPSYDDGTTDEAAIWSRVLTAQERSDRHNSGSGLFY